MPMTPRTAQRFAHYSPEQRAISGRLQAVPNVGPAIADDLMRLGLACPTDLAGRDPDALYDALCRLDCRRHDPCVRDVFAAAIAFADGAPARPWWTFTPDRKAREAASRHGR